MTEDGAREQYYDPSTLSHPEIEAVLRDLAARTPNDSERALERLGLWIDYADALRDETWINAALQLGEELLQAERSSASASLIHYYLANAWEAKRLAARSGWALQDWEQPELDQQIIHLRLAIRAYGDAPIDRARICQIHTNLGNLFGHCGRPIDAIASWNAALQVDPEFAMALGNRGYGLAQYARRSHDPGHRMVLVREGYNDLRRALSRRLREQLHPGAMTGFKEAVSEIRQAIPNKALHARHADQEFRKRMPKAERAYRMWCLRHGLFLNDLNEIGPDLVAAADVLSLPNISTPLDAPLPGVIGFFSQLKQEYASARFLFYESVTADKPHYSDREVKVVNTLDYPLYGIAAEKAKIAFRVAYSILDKVAYLLNDYLALDIPERSVSFRGIWYRNQQPQLGLRADLHKPSNSALKGLFWLSKDLFEKSADFTAALEPEAQKIAEMRNHLEHKYLKLHLFGPPGDGGEALAYSVGRTEFDQSVLWLLRTARSALIYVCQAIYIEEHFKPSTEGVKSLPVFLDILEDRFKV